MDNYEAHVAVDNLVYAKENGIVVLTLPPHCSDRMQPLDKTVFKSSKGSYNRSVENWQVNNPLKPLTIYHVAGLVNEAYTKSFTPSNIRAGFSSTGIFPFDLLQSKWK